MDISLDDLIKQKKIGRVPNRPVRRGIGPRPGVGGGGGGGGGPRAGLATGRGGRLGGARQANGLSKKPAAVSTGAVKKRVTDLRLLIGKRAAPVRDAREKLSTRVGPPSRPPRPSAPAPKPISDARDRLSNRNKSTPIPVSRLMSGRGKYEPLPRRTLENRAQVRKPHTYMDLEEQRLRQRSRVPASRSGSLLLRTVDNSRPSDLMDIDPWDEPSALPYKNNVTKYQNVTRTFSSEESWRPVSSPLSQLSRRMPALSKRPETSRSHQSEGYRIVVSNLQPSVTHEDIKELFEDIGFLYSSRVVRPGTAEVVYKSLDDAMKAVDTYHNRQLDGQPMKCFLINPSKQSSSNTARSSKGLVVPDLIAIHKALFNK